MAGVTDQIKERIDIVEFISAYVPLRKAGRVFVGFCPFHQNTKTPAFNVFPDTQSFHCFGCKASGTVFDFLMRREGLEFKDALEHLAQRAGIQLHERSTEELQLDQLRTRLLAIHADAATFFRHLLVKSARGETARQYVAARHIDEATAEAFQLGYSADDWSLLLSYLTDRKGYDSDDLEAAGLVVRHETRGLFDRFRNRLIFPIRNVKGDIIAFGGRAFGDAQPKYMNSPQTALFDKSHVLYGLDLARDAIRDSESAVIVEGYVDVIMAHQYGFRNVVAPLGTALTPDHVAQLKKLARTIYLALDADAAGLRATLKGLQVLGENPQGELSPVTSPQGIIGWQRKLDIDIRIIELPDGKDPDEVIQANPDQWRTLIAAARPAMDFYIRALTGDLDLSQARSKAEAVERLGPLIAQMTNPVEQSHYIQQVARLVQVDEATLRKALPMRPGPPTERNRPFERRGPQAATKARTAPQAVAPGGFPQHEDYLIGWLLRYVPTRRAVEEKLRLDLAAFDKIQQFVDGSILELFKRIENRALWELWRVQPDETDLDTWVAGLESVLRDHALLVLGLRLPETQAYRSIGSALECAKMLQEDLARNWIHHLSRQSSEADNDDERLELLERLVQLKEYLGALSTPRRSATYADLHTTLQSG